MKISNKEITILKKIAMYQQDLIDGMKAFKVSETSDLTKINRMVRRITFWLLPAYNTVLKKV